MERPVTLAVRFLSVSWSFVLRYIARENSDESRFKKHLPSKMVKYLRRVVRFWDKPENLLNTRGKQVASYDFKFVNASRVFSACVKLEYAAAKRKLFGSRGTLVSRAAPRRTN